MKVQVGPSCLDLGRIEVVSEPIRGDVTAVRACNDEIRGLLAVARFADEFSELWRYGLGRIARRRLRVLQSTVLVGRMADAQCLGF